MTEGGPCTMFLSPEKPYAHGAKAGYVCYSCTPSPALASECLVRTANSADGAFALCVHDCSECVYQ